MRTVYCTITDGRGRPAWDGLVPGTSDRDAIGRVLRGELPAGPAFAPRADETYRVRAGGCAATARGDELRRVDEAATLDESRLMPAGGRYLHEEPTLSRADDKQTFGKLRDPWGQASKDLANRLLGVGIRASDVLEVSRSGDRYVIYVDPSVIIKTLPDGWNWWGLNTVKVNGRWMTAHHFTVPT